MGLLLLKNELTLLNVLIYNQISINTKNSHKWKPFDTLGDLSVRGPTD